MARPDPILTSGSVDGDRCSIITDPDVAGDWRLAFFVRPSLYRSRVSALWRGSQDELVHLGASWSFARVHAHHSF